MASLCFSGARRALNAIRPAFYLSSGSLGTSRLGVAPVRFAGLGTWAGGTLVGGELLTP